MVHRNNAGKLLLFPAPTPPPGSADRKSSHRILETKDNLISALEFLRIAYNEMLAGRSVKSADEVLAPGSKPFYEMMHLRTRLLRPSGFLGRSRRKRNQRSCCSFPQFEAVFSRCTQGDGV
jgi:hypothetical protein